jgi:hypothetical protein
MGRDELKSKAEVGGYVEYGKEQLPKIESMRRDKSQPDFYGIPILHDQDVMFTTASELGDKPASCYTCQIQQSDLTCGLLGPDVRVAKVTGSRDSGDPIEYWPCCGAQDYGPTQTGPAKYRSNLSTPDQVGLIWINAPEIGQKYGGANCGGVNGGDDCDHYITQGAVEKWDAPQGICRVLQHTVNSGDVCVAWRDDDVLDWQYAQQLMKGDSVETVKKRKMVDSIIGKDDDDDD